MNWTIEALIGKREKREKEIGELLEKVGKSAFGVQRGSSLQSQVERELPDHVNDTEFDHVPDEDAINARARLRELGMTDDQINKGAGRIIQAKGFLPYSAGESEVAKRVGEASRLIERKSRRKPKGAIRFKPEDVNW